jgi:hypothetical protein
VRLDQSYSSFPVSLTYTPAAHASISRSPAPTPHASRTRKRPANWSASIARGSHPFPSRTRSLSLVARMVLQRRLCGRVRRRRPSLRESPELHIAAQGFFVILGKQQSPQRATENHREPLSSSPQFPRRRRVGETERVAFQPAITTPKPVLDCFSGASRTGAWRTAGTFIAGTTTKICSPRLSISPSRWKLLVSVEPVRLRPNVCDDC